MSIMLKIVPLVLAAAPFAAQAQDAKLGCRFGCIHHGCRIGTGLSLFSINVISRVLYGRAIAGFQRNPRRR